MVATAYRYLVNVPGVCAGRTIVEGTRIGVHDLVGLIVNGASVDDVLRSFPDLTRAQVYECLAYTRTIAPRSTRWWRNRWPNRAREVPARPRCARRPGLRTPSVRPRSQLLRTVLPVTAPDDDILRFAGERDEVLIRCNRDDFLAASSRIPHVGLVVVICRRSRAQERAALIRLVDRAGEAGIRHNINFA